MFRNI
ncbi:Protein CBG26401 [Caenorhabditis briggsae]|jgi:ABC-type bacteriocin/lantibiotic exporter with double-glycine peptidase domain